jgi:hypothetical protein
MQTALLNEAKFQLFVCFDLSHALIKTDFPGCVRLPCTAISIPASSCSRPVELFLNAVCCVAKTQVA